MRPNYGILKGREDELRRLYESERLTTHEIAQRLSVARSGVHAALKRIGVALRDARTSRHRVNAVEVAHLYESGQTKSELARAFGVSATAIANALDRAGCARRQRAYAKGEESHLWRGGRTIHAAGYILIYRPEHPRATARGGYVFEHILVMERVLGGPLPDGMEVHHINHIKTDNRPENLQLLSKRERARLHQKLKAGGA